MPWSDYISSPISYRNRVEGLYGSTSRRQYELVDNSTPLKILSGVHALSSHPNFANLTLLVFEAVLEVVCVSFPGYIVAQQGLFDAEAQKFVANLNVMLFTPCLIFSKLASQLTADKLQDLAIIPLIFIVQTLVSFTCAWTISTVFRFKKRQKSFVIAMGVFGNSNSLPISLVVSLSKTLQGLHWAKVPGDNDDEVAARGILYLMIFQQLGQLMRWTWGYNVLLAPADRFTEEEGGTARAANLERGRDSYHDDARESESQRLLSPSHSDEYDSNFDDEPTRVHNSPTASRAKSPDAPHKHSSQASSEDNLPHTPDLLPTPANGNVAPKNFDLRKSLKPENHDESVGGIKGFANKVWNSLISVKDAISRGTGRLVQYVPLFIRAPVRAVWNFIVRFFSGVWAFMNPPLWAMLVAIIVASIPKLQQMFFQDGNFIRNSVTRAIEQNAGVAVPLILVVLGGNLARNTLPKDDRQIDGTPAEERKILIAALVSRLVLPTVIMAPLLAVMAKFVPVSILDDKIFIIVCFLLTGAPSALQLAQICQINNVYTGVMSRILFQSYVIWILPSTLVLVLLALETVNFAETK